MRKMQSAGALVALLAIGSISCGASPAGSTQGSVRAGNPESNRRTANATVGAHPSAAAATPEPLRIAAWNIEWLTLRDERGARTAADFEGLKRYAAELDADIVALQEVDGAEAAKLVFDPDAYEFHFTHDTDNVQRAGFAWKKGFDVRPNVDLNALAIPHRRPGADVTVHWGGRELRLLSIHLKSGCSDRPLSADNGDCRILRMQLPALESWVDARAREGAAFAVLGDFNRTFEDGDEFWRELDDSDPPGADLTDTGAGAHPGCWGGRYKRYIDHIVLSPSIAPWVAPHSFHELVFESRPGRKEFLSDHCPISLTLSPQSNRSWEPSGTTATIPSPPPVAVGRISAVEAAAHIGEVATVCGGVASTKFLEQANRMTFLDLDAPHPHQKFTIVIREADRKAFDRPEVGLLHKQICVTGTVETYKGKPQIVARTPDQIEVDSAR